jgi:hypothetical protein
MPIDRTLVYETRFGKWGATGQTTLLGQATIANNGTRTTETSGLYGDYVATFSKWAPKEKGDVEEGRRKRLREALRKAHVMALGPVCLLFISFSYAYSSFQSPRGLT